MIPRLSISLIGVLFIAAVVSCDKSGSDTGPNAPPAPQSGAETPPAPETPTKTTGKQTPDEVLDAMIAAAKAGDEEAYFEVQTDDSDVAVNYEQLVEMLKGDGTREDGVKNFMATAADGFSTEESGYKRFPAEISGESAVILTLYPSPLFPDRVQYSRYDFVKSGELWYYKKKSLGKYGDLDAEKYPFDGDRGTPSAPVE